MTTPTPSRKAIAAAKRLAKLTAFGGEQRLFIAKFSERHDDMHTIINDYIRLYVKKEPK